MIPFPMPSKLNTNVVDYGTVINGTTFIAFHHDKKCSVRGAYFANASTPQNSWVALSGNGDIDRVYAGQYLTVLINDAKNSCIVYGSDHDWMGLPTGVLTRLDISAKLSSAGIIVSLIKDIQMSSFNCLFILMTNGDLYFWGNNTKNVSGSTSGSTTSFGTPTKVNSGVSELSLGYSFSNPMAFCTKDGTAYCSGAVNSSGFPVFTSTPVNNGWVRCSYLDNNNGFRCGGEHVLYKTASNDLYFMGRSFYGQCGNGIAGATIYNTGIGFKVASSVDLFEDSEYHTLYTTIGAPNLLNSFGRNNYGQLTQTGTTDVDTTTPSSTALPTPIKSVRNNTRLSFIIISTSTNVYLAGYGGGGALGIPADTAVNQFRTFTAPF